MQEKPDKAALRQALLANRQLIAQEVREAWDRKIGEHVLAWWRSAGVCRIGVYWPIRGEPDLRAVYRQLTDEGAQIALPVVGAKSSPLSFAAWTPGDALITGAFGVAVPPPGTMQVEPEALLIPCVGFNARRQRLGYGGGYYDRTLAQRQRPIAIGIAYANARCEFEGGQHDIALDRIITDEAAGQ